MARALRAPVEALHARAPFDIISAEFSWPEGPAAVALGRRLGVPVAIKARGMDFTRRARGSTGRRLIEACRAAQTLLAVSEDVKAQMVAAGLPGDRIFVHSPAVDPSLFSPGDPAAAKARLGIHGPLLLCVGNLIPEKGHRLAVEALALLDEATLIIVGGGPEREALMAKAKALGVAGRLRLAGSIPHPLLPAFYRAADVTLHPSRIEGFGNVRLESLACGIPVVTTAVGDARSILDRDAAGRVVRSDPSAIAEAVGAILADPPDPGEVRETARRFSWERQAGELAGHLRAAAAASPAAS
jgi:glycosyltransferase involved in cell wall biosynthesis